MKFKRISVFLLCLALGLTGGIMAFADETAPEAVASTETSVSAETPVPEAQPESSPEEAPEADAETDAETDTKPETEAQPGVYSPNLVLLSSTAWDDVLGDCVTGEFSSIGDALRALNAPYPLYYPAADGGHAQTYGGSVLILLNNPVMVMDPATGCSTTYQSIQMNYHTSSIQNVKITLGYAPELSSRHFDETYVSGEHTFYLQSCTNLVNGNTFYILTGVVDGCYYSVTAYDAEAAKNMIDSLIPA